MLNIDDVAPMDRDDVDLRSLIEEPSLKYHIVYFVDKVIVSGMALFLFLLIFIFLHQWLLLGWFFRGHIVFAIATGCTIFSWASIRVDAFPVDIKYFIPIHFVHLFQLFASIFILSQPFLNFLELLNIHILDGVHLLKDLIDLEAIEQKPQDNKDHK